MTRKLLFLGCNTDQVPYLEVLQNQDWKIVGSDLNNEAPGKIFCDSFHNIGYDDFQGLIKLGIKEVFTENDKVFTAAAQFAQKGAAHFSKHFNIPFPSEESIDTCLDKTRFYESFSKNNIPIPKTWNIKNVDELKDKINELNAEWFYLKSDFSKNPNYVYRFSSSNIPLDKIFWGKDRYLRNFYVLQEQFQGTSIRINIFGDRFNVFDFLNGNKTHIYDERLFSLNIIQILKNFMRVIQMEKWLIKFDVILNKQDFVVLDIGMDPPCRMLKESERNNINFAEHYLNQYLNLQITYPSILS